MSLCRAITFYHATPCVSAILTVVVRGRPLVCDVTVPDTYADAHVVNTTREARAAANHAATNKNTKDSQLSNTHAFVPVVIETWHHQAVELVGPTCQGVQLPVPAAVRGTTEGECGLTSKHVYRQLARCNPLFHFLNVLVPTGFVLAGQKNNNRISVAPYGRNFRVAGGRLDQCSVKA